MDKQLLKAAAFLCAIITSLHNMHAIHEILQNMHEIQHITHAEMCTVFYFYLLHNTSHKINKELTNTSKSMYYT